MKQRCIPKRALVRPDKPSDTHLKISIDPVPGEKTRERNRGWAIPAVMHGSLPSEPFHPLN
jgi:hypothetical protein